MSNKKINDGGPAFPFGQVSEVSGQPINGYHNDGMSRRDVFAKAAMQGLVRELIGAGANMHPDESIRQVVDTSCRMADALIAALDGDGDE